MGRHWDAIVVTYPYGAVWRGGAGVYIIKYVSTVDTP